MARRVSNSSAVEVTEAGTKSKKDPLMCDKSSVRGPEKRSKTTRESAKAGKYSGFLGSCLGIVPPAGLKKETRGTKKRNASISCSEGCGSSKEASTADEQYGGDGKRKFNRANDLDFPDDFNLCKNCELLNSPHATDCAGCHAIMDPAASIRKRKARKRGTEIETEANIKVSLTCQLCDNDNDDGYELESCKHRFCRPCLLLVVAEMLSVLPPVTVASSDDALSLLPCPLKGCGYPLSRQDIRTVSGQDALCFIDDWTLKLLDRRFFSVLQNNCPNCIVKPILTSLISADHLQDMEKHDICEALAARGLKCKGGKSSCLKRLKDAIMCVASSASFSLCKSCDTLVCDKCGQELTDRFPSMRDINQFQTSDNQPVLLTHECEPNKRKCFTICRCILELNSAYYGYNGGKQVPSDQQREEAPKVLDSACCSSSPKASASSSSYGALRQLIGAVSLNDLLPPSNKGKTLSTKGKLLSTALYNTNTNQQPKWKEDSSDSQSYDEFDPFDQWDADDISDSNNKGNKHTYYEAKHAAAEAENLADKQMTVALHELSLELSNLTKGEFQLLRLTAALLCSHEVPRKVAHWLIRNDSIADITSRVEVYNELLSFLRLSGKHSELLPLLCSPHSKYDFWTQPQWWQTRGCMMETFEKLYKQARFMVFEYQQGNIGIDDEVSAVELVLVEEVKDTYEQLQSQIEKWERASSHPWIKDADDSFQKVRAGFSSQEKYLELHHTKTEKSSIEALASSVHPSRKTSKKGIHDSQHAGKKQKDVGDATGGITMPSTEEIEAYKNALQPLQFRQESLLGQHYFRNHKVNGNLNNKSRSLSVLKEIASLSTSLPLEWQSSIVVRLDDCRIDLLKALIIGPLGTPYQNGVFIFDLMLGEDYPVTPPEMQFLTTGGGQIRFNPNLYASGKVCLSLLGTWTGPSWKPFESTILQLLVSIQGLVLVDDPYFNEPGFEILPNCAAAKDYNQEQRLNTLLHSILPALRNPDPSFQDVILTHFRKKQRELEEQCNSWAKERSSFQKQIVKAAQDVKNELQKLISSD